MQCYIATLYNLKCELYKPELPRVTGKSPDNICHIQFSNKEIGLINLVSTFDNSDVTSLIDNYFKSPNPKSYLTEPTRFKS